MVPFGLGKINLPNTWEVRSQITLLEPEDAGLQAPLAMRQSAAKPRANFVISRQETGDGSSVDAREEFLEQSAQAIPGLKLHGKDDVAFADGGQGASVTLSFSATPQIRLAQRHVFRKDGKVLTQIVVTVDEHRLSELDGPLLDAVRSYSAAS
ncbi:MAG: hypothetical protein AAFY60_09625 [Myxococcota bacterium]